VPAPGSADEAIESPWIPRTILGTVLLVAAGLRLNGIAGTTLWYDELQAVTHAVQPIPDLLRSVLSLDPHPPVWYLQLHLWMQLGTGNAWLALNSVALGVLAVASLYWTTARTHDSSTALWAAALLAVAPAALIYGQEVRMYAWLMLLAVWSVYLSERLLRAQRPLPWAAVYVPVTLLASYSQGVAFLLLACVGTQALFGVLRRESTRGGLVAWLVANALVLVLLVPWLLRALGIRVGHAKPVSLASLVEVLGLWTLGETAPQGLWSPIFVGLVLLTLGTVSLCAKQRHTLEALCVCLAPLLVASGIGLAGDSFLHVRAIAFALPFFALACGCAAATLVRGELRLPRVGLESLRLLAAGLVAVLILAGWSQTRALPGGSQLAEVARSLAVRSAEPRTIFVSQPKDGWGLCWQMVGAGSARPRLGAGALCASAATRIVHRQTPPPELASGRELWRVERRGRTSVPPEASQTPWRYVVGRLGP
jgi:hypothetical protein